MRRRSPTFAQSFKDDVAIALPFSVISAFGSHQFFQDPLPVKLPLVAVAVLWSAVAFSAVLAAAQAWLFPRLRFASFALTVLATAVGYLAVILVGVPLGVGGTAALAAHGPHFFDAALRAVAFVMRPQLVGVAFALMVAVTLFFMVRKKLGPGVLENWVLGRYYRPREEERVFMFLDLKDSTALGERMGDMSFSRLIQRFFEDITDPVLSTKGEVSHYIGDEAVLTWKWEHGLRDAHVLRCFFAIVDTIAANAPSYEDEFGLVPRFKAGAHLGKVVTTQVGEVKSEIVYHGDVLNTTSRIQGLCNALSADLLVSQQLAEALGPDCGFVFEPRGDHEVKGKGAVVSVLAAKRP